MVNGHEDFTMTVIQQKKIMTRIQQVEEDIEALKKARIEAVMNGYASATISSSGGSKSYTRIDADKITSIIKELMKELHQLQGLLTTGKANPLKTIVTVYC